MRSAAIALILMLMLGPRPASADAVDDAVQELANNTNRKDRLVAGVQLTQSGDARAIAALADALLHDRDKLVRGLAAIGLGKVVTAASSAADLQRAVTALGKASKQDKDKKVRRRAKKSYDKLLRLAAPSSGTYVDLGPMSAPRGNTKLAAHVRQIVDALVNQQPGMQTTSAAATGFHLDATITKLARVSGKLECRVEIVVADYPTKVQLMLSTGSASVASTTGSASSAVTDCVDAVVDSLLTKKVFPYITQLATPATVTQTSSTTTTTTTSSSSSTTAPSP